MRFRRSALPIGRCREACTFGKTNAALPGSHETHRLPLLRPLDAVAAVAGALGLRCAQAIDRARRRGRGAGRGRGLLPGASLRAPARLAVSALGGVRRAHKRIEIGTAVIDMRYENPLYMAE